MDNEWEYEYDPVETESFYIPIDLSNIPNKAPQNTSPSPRTGHPTLLKSRLRALNAQRTQQDNSAVTNSTNNPEPANVAEAQIIGLHTQNPLVMYNGQLLSCQWAATIGTDLFFAKPDDGAEAEGGERPLRELPGVNLLAMSGAKLVARVGRLRPRDEVFEGVGEGADGVVRDVDVAVQDAAQPEMDGDAQEAAQVLEPAPTSFLARFNEVKAKRGDKTRLVVSRSGDSTSLVSEATPAVNETGEENGDVEMGGT